MRATKSNMRDQIITNDDHILHCPGCGAEYSGNAGDYWDYPDDYIFSCAECELELELVRKVVITNYVD